jgi:hypothetical protein
MTRVGNSGQNPVNHGGGSADGGLQRGLHPEPRPSSRQAAALNDRVKLPASPASGVNASDRVAAFARSMRAAGGEDVATLADRPNVSILAVAEWFGGSLSATPPAAEPASDASPIRSIHAIVAAVTARVEQAIAAEHRLAPDAPVNVRVDLGGAVAGLEAVTITLSSTGLDILLERAEGDPSPELVQAAQALADRLSMRFARRTIRILDRAADAGEAGADRAPAEGGLQAISAMLAHSAPDP